MRQLQRLFKGRGRQQLKPLAQIIAGLFKGGAPGAWYDPSDINLNWRYNLLTYTEQFDNAAWVKSAATVTANTAVAPDGTLTADKLAAISIAVINHQAYQTGITVVSGVPYKWSAYLKAGEYSWGILNAYDTGTTNRFCYFDLQNGVIGTMASGCTGTIASVGNGWYFCTVTKTTGGASGGLSVEFSNADNTPSFAASIGHGIYIWGASLTTVANASLPYQQIVTPEISYLNYQPQPILYQDSAGTTPVTAVEQPVGLMLDKSQGLVLGPQLVTNGDFATNTSGWNKGTGTTNSTFIATGGSATLTVVGSESTARYVTAITGCVVGNFYLVSVGTFTTTGAGDRRWGWTSASDGTGGVNYATSQTTPRYIAATATTMYVWVGFAQTGVDGSTLTVDNISVRELPGNHAFQSTAASRPVLSARYNLLTKTEQFDDAAWNTGNLRNLQITANATLAPDGTLTADKAVEAPAASGSVNQRVIYSDGTATATKVFSVYAKQAERKRIYLFVNGPDDGAWFDLSNGTFGAATDYPGGAATIQDVGSGWYRCSLIPNGASGSGSFVQIVVIGDAATTFDIRVGDGTSGVYIWGASLVPSNQSTLPYQRVNTATDYNTVGFLPFLKFDGIDDSLSTNSINFTSTDKMSVFAGVRKLSDAALGIVAELSVDSATNSGSFRVFAPLTAGVGNYNFRSRGTLAADATAAGFSAPITSTITGLGDISGDLATLRINGTQAAQSTADQGTGNYGTYPLYIGRRGGTTLPFNGQLYSMIIVGKAVQAGELTSAEKYVNSKTKAY